MKQTIVVALVIIALSFPQVVLAASAGYDARANNFINTAINMASQGSVGPVAADNFEIRATKDIKRAGSELTEYEKEKLNCLVGALTSWLMAGGRIASFHKVRSDFENCELHIK